MRWYTTFVLYLSTNYKNTFRGTYWSSSSERRTVCIPVYMIL